jgi:hypothetical protein
VFYRPSSFLVLSNSGNCATRSMALKSHAVRTKLLILLFGSLSAGVATSFFAP